VDAAIRHIEAGGERAIITHLDKAIPALAGETGTHVVRG
jgi:carbamate kinase